GVALGLARRPDARTLPRRSRLGDLQERLDVTVRWFQRPRLQNVALRFGEVPLRHVALGLVPKGRDELPLGGRCGCGGRKLAAKERERFERVPLFGRREPSLLDRVVYGLCQLREPRVARLLDRRPDAGPRELGRPRRSL